MNLLKKMKMWLLAAAALLTGLFAGNHFTAGNAIDFTIIDGNCTAVVPLNSPQFYTLMSIAAIPTAGQVTTIIITEVATFKFSPCESVSIRQLLADVESGKIPLIKDWEKRGDAYVATDTELAVVVPVIIRTTEL